MADNENITEIPTGDTPLLVEQIDPHVALELSEVPSPDGAPFAPQGIFLCLTCPPGEPLTIYAKSCGSKSTWLKVKQFR